MNSYNKTNVLLKLKHAINSNYTVSEQEYTTRKIGGTTSDM
jgi:hypothetical protein